MVAVARGAALSAANPLLSDLAIWHGKLVEPVALAWSIYRIATPAEEDEPVLIAGPTDVDLDADRVSAGRYAVAWTVPADATLGRYEVRWTGQMVASDPVLTWRREFEVVATAGIALAGYVLPADMRREGVSKNTISNADLRRRIFEASSFIDRVTGAWFEPRPRSYMIDGSGRPALLLDQPLVGVEAISLSGTLVAPEGYRAYVRGTDEVSAWAPMIARVHDIEPSMLPFGLADQTYRIAPNWPRLRQNVQIAGWFGYLEPDGSPAGGTPPLILQACKMLVIRNLAPMGDADAVFEAKSKHRIVSERTREQSFDLARGGGAVGDGREAAFTGDPEIDTLLEMYVRPPYVGFAGL